MYSHWPWAHGMARTCPCQCIYLILSEGNVHVTVRNYKYGVRGAVFRHVLTAEACFFKLSEPAAVALHPAACWKLPLKQSCRGQGVTAQHRNGMFLPGSRSSLQSPEGPRDHLRPPTHASSILLRTFLHFHLPLPALPMAAHFADSNHSN